MTNETLAPMPPVTEKPENGFAQFNLPPKMMTALNRLQFSEPTPIQTKAIPLALEGRDILGSAQTGTGKTGAFGIPLIAGLMKDENATALVMTPTRELATQVMEALRGFIQVPNIKTALLIGGDSMSRQFRQLEQNARLIVGTPGRINDHLNRGSLELDRTGFLVLDETDRMLDMGFGPQIDQIMEYIPEDRQTMLFSATLPENIIRLSRKYLRNPERIAAGSTYTPAAKIDQQQIEMNEGDKYEHLLEQLDQRTGSVIIFVKTKFGTERLAKRLNGSDHAADAIHGGLQQRRRERVIHDFRDQKYRILVATDVAARGLDIPHIEHVINYDLPQVPEDYIHRIGRTARAGAEGAAVNFITPSERGKWRAISALMSGKPTNEQDNRDNGGQRRKSNGGGGGRGWGSGGKGRTGGNREGGNREGGNGYARREYKGGGDNNNGYARRESSGNREGGNGYAPERSGGGNWEPRGEGRPAPRREGGWGEKRSGGGSNGRSNQARQQSRGAGARTGEGRGNGGGERSSGGAKVTPRNRYA